MLHVYSRNRSITRVLSGPDMRPLDEPLLDLNGALIWRFEGEELEGVREVVPSFTDVGSPELTCRFSVRAKAVSGDSGEVHFDWLGDGAIESNEATESGPLTLDIDTLKVGGPLRSLEVRLEFQGEIRPSSEIVVGISLRGPRAPIIEGRLIEEGELVVPPLSQFEQSRSIGHRICSPTALAMVLNYHGYPVSAVEIARRSYARKHDLYGVWPKNVWAAATIGAPACLMHIESWHTVDHLLRLDIPVIASIRYRRGELRGAAFTRESDELTGHLVVVRGVRGSTILVNDPGARSAAEVAREYDRDEFTRVWFERSAMAYLVLPPHVLRDSRIQ